MTFDDGGWVDGWMCHDLAYNDGNGKYYKMKRPKNKNRCHYHLDV